jgi:hypothetical protein
VEPGENNIFLAHQLLVVEPLFFDPTSAAQLLDRDPAPL